MPEKKVFIILLFIVMIIFSGIYGPSAYVYVCSKWFGKLEIDSTVKMIVSTETDTYIILDRIADWICKNITYDQNGSYIFPFSPFKICRVSPADPFWTIIIKRGACEEQAVLFAEMARCTGMECRVVYNPAEDHVWNEVLMNGTWMHFDVGLSSGQRLNNPGIYESERGSGKQLSYVYFIDSDGNQHDITSQYTNTGRLVVRVEKDNLSVENARITVESRFLIETYPLSEQYKEPRPCLDKYTNASGICTFDLGENNYTIIVESGQVIGYRSVTNIHLDENDTLLITLHPNELSLLLSPIQLFIISFILMVIAFTTAILIIYKILRKQRLKEILGASL